MEDGDGFRHGSPDERLRVDNFRKECDRITATDTVIQGNRTDRTDGDETRDVKPDLPNDAGANPHPAGLRRQIGAGSATAMVAANVIGQGIFTTTGFLGHDLQHPGLVLVLWLLGGALSLGGALCYAELGTILQRPGGEYAFLHAAFGPLAGFLCGWACFLASFSAPIALCALVFVRYSAVFVPQLDAESGWHIPLPFDLGSLPVANVAAAALVVVVAQFHYRRVSSGIRAQDFLTAIKAAAIVLLIASAFLSGKAEPARLLETGDVPPIGELLPAMGMGFLFITLSYSGWNAATYLAAEVKDPRRVLPLATILGTLTVTAIYLIMNVLYFMTVPVRSMEAKENIAALAAAACFGTAGERIISAVILFSQLATIGAMVLAGSRVYFAMGEDGVAWRGLAKLTGDDGTPRRAVAVQGGIAAAMALGSGFSPLALYSSFVLLLSSAAAVASLLVLRRRFPQEPGSFRAPLGGWIPGLYLAACFSISIFAGWGFWKNAQQKPYLAIAGPASLLAGLPVYWLSTRGRRGARTARETAGREAESPPDRR
jgi:APA family basic amino acid/polyamine antiporter